MIFLKKRLSNMPIALPQGMVALDTFIRPNKQVIFSIGSSEVDSLEDKVDQMIIDKNEPPSLAMGEDRSGGK